jgi:hypothetical protein
MIITYADVDKTELVSVQHIESSNISSTGNIGTRTITSYSDVTFQDNDSTKAILSLSGEQGRQTINTSEFDDRGNAVRQTILSEGWIKNAWEFSGMQDILLNAKQEQDVPS